MGEDAGDRLPECRAYADEGARGHSGLLRQVAEVSSDQDGRAQAQGRDGRTPAEMRCRRDIPEARQFPGLHIHGTLSAQRAEVQDRQATLLPARDTGNLSPCWNTWIRTYTDEGDIVLDFAMGSGSTAVACRNTGRRFVGVEIDREIFQTALNRITHG